VGAEPAPDFRLTDQSGAPLTLAQFRGRPVVLTFLYTECPDVCPVTAQRIAQALHHLGNDAGKVAVLAVSVDPDGDTPAKAAAFMQRHGLTGADHHFLVGEGDLLAPVWLAYGVASTPIATAQRQPGEPAQFGRVGHTDATFLIDREGRKRTLLRGDATAEDYARGLRILLR
jgi:protein SCO1/2